MSPDAYLDNAVKMLGRPKAEVSRLLLSLLSMFPPPGQPLVYKADWLPDDDMAATLLPALDGWGLVAHNGPGGKGLSLTPLGVQVLGHLRETTKADTTA